MYLSSQIPFEFSNKSINTFTAYSLVERTLFKFQILFILLYGIYSTRRLADSFAGRVTWIYFAAKILMQTQKLC